MWRGPFAVAVCLLAYPTLADTLLLPASPNAGAVAIVAHDDGSTTELRQPAAYDQGDYAGSSFGASGDLDGGLALIGAPAAWWEGVAFLYDANTGALLHTLSPLENLEGGRGRPQFGAEVDLADGYAGVIATQAGATLLNFRGPGAAVLYNAASGVKLGSIWGEVAGSYISDLAIGGGQVALTYTDYNTQATQVLSYALPALVPEPSAVMLVIVGLTAGLSRRATLPPY